MSEQILAAAAVASSTKTGAPTVSESVKLDWGSAAAQFLKAETQILESLAAGGVALALNQIPFGSMISMFVGPKVVKQYVDQALTTLEGILEGQPPAVASNAIEKYVFAAINSYEPELAKMLGDQLTPLIKGLMVKAGIAA